MNPETEVACFIDTQISSSREMTAQVPNQRSWSWWLTESLMLHLTSQDTNLPALLARVQTHINLLTPEVKFGILSLLFPSVKLIPID